MGLRRVAGTALALALALLPGALAGQVAASPGCSPSPMTFGQPVLLEDGSKPARGFEPGIEIDSAGTVFVTAAKTFPTQGSAHLSSYLWRSHDGGRTFEPLPGLADNAATPYAFEGDIAVDGKDRLYFLDTFLGDNHVYRFGDHGRVLESYQPAVGTTGLDDRPWVAAHGDGYVYALVNGVAGPEGRLTVHRSTDAGKSFDPTGFTFPESGLGFIDADPNSPFVYAVFVEDLIYDSVGGLASHEGTPTVRAWTSGDRGQTWVPSTLAVEARAMPFPGVAVAPNGGTVYAYWNTRDKLMLARSSDRGKTWRTFDVTPFEGTFDNQWAAVGLDGTVSMVFRGQQRGSGEAFLYALAWREKGSCAGASRCAGPATSLGRLHPNPGYPQEHFFQLDVSADGAVNVAFQNQQSELFFVKQVDGPNMRRGGWCGGSGKPSA